VLRGAEPLEIRLVDRVNARRVPPGLLAPLIRRGRVLNVITHPLEARLGHHLTLTDHLLHVSHRAGRIDVSGYFRAPLLLEEREDLLPEEVESASIYHEGATRRIQVNAYERDRHARRRCIEHYGRCCVVCQMAFAEVYGPEVESLIHVHHLVPLSTIGQEYELDPIRDLRPVCPNCHAVIHSRNPAYTIEEATKMFAAHSARIGAYPHV
jgi:hypothetical protein